MENKTENYNCIDALNSLGEIVCSVGQMEFIQRAMIELQDGCTPASLLDAPFDKIKESLKDIENYLEDIRSTR